MQSVLDSPVEPVLLPRRFNNFEVNVNEEDIQLGVRGNENRCPVARATHRYLSTHYKHNNVDVDVFKKYTLINGTLYRMRSRDKWAITLYDITGIMHPRTFKFTKAN